MANIVEIPNERPREVRPKLNANFGALNAELIAATAAIAGKAASSHTHALADITGLVSALAGKADLAGDLAALEGLTGTDTLYYRNGNASWVPVTFGANVTFSGGQLSATGGGGGGSGTVTSVAAAVSGAGLSVSGSPITGAGTLTFGLVNDLAAVEALATTGLVRRTATDTWSAGTAVALASEVSGILPVANGGTGTATPGLVSGTNISISGTWPNQTVASTQTSVTGNAGTATALQNARTINGVSFDGTANVTVPAAAGTLTGATLASGVTASSLTSAAGGAFGGAAYLNVGTTSGTVAAGNDSRLSDARTPTAHVHSGDALTPASLAAVGIVTGSNLSGTNTGDNAVNSLYSGLVSNATHTGDATGSTALTLATVNSNVGTYGSATAAPSITVNAKGLVTAVTTNTITPAVGSITGLGTGIATALAVNTGSAGAPVLFNGAGGTPSSLTLTNCTGLPLTTGVTGVLPAANVGAHASTHQQGGSDTLVPALSAYTFASTMDLAFTAAPQRRSIAVTGNLTLTGSGYADGREYKAFFAGDTVPRTLSFPSGWVFVGAKPTELAANKAAVLSLECTSGSESGVRCAWGVQT